MFEMFDQIFFVRYSYDEFTSVTIYKDLFRQRRGDFVYDKRVFYRFSYLYVRLDLLLLKSDTFLFWNRFTYTLVYNITKYGLSWATTIVSRSAIRSFKISTKRESYWKRWNVFIFQYFKMLAFAYEYLILFEQGVYCGLPFIESVGPNFISLNRIFFYFSGH